MVERTDWKDVSAASPSGASLLRKTRDDGFFAEVWQVGNQVGWSVWSPGQTVALRSGRNEPSRSAALIAAEKALEEAQ